MEPVTHHPLSAEDRPKSPIKVRVRRFDPTKDDAPRMQEYEIPFSPGQSVLSLLMFISEHMDPTLAFPLCLCRIGACNQCAMKIDGKSMLTCNRIVGPGETITVEPASERHFIRDLT